MYKKAFWWLITGGVLLGATSCYKDVMEMEIDPLHPEIVAPALRDSLTVAEMLGRKAESTTFEYAADGTCVAVYKEKKKFSIGGVTREITKRAPEVVIDNIDLSNTSAQNQEALSLDWMFEPGVNASQAYFDKESEGVSIKLLYTHTVSSAEMSELKGNIEFGGYSQNFTAVSGEYTYIPLKEWIEDENFALQLKHTSSGTDVYNRILYKLNSLQLTGGSNKKIKIRVQLDFKKLYLRKLIGKTIGGVPQTSAKEPYTKNLDIFSTMLKAQVELPETSILFHIKRATTTELNMVVVNMQAKPSEIRDDIDPALVNGIKFQNKDLSSLSPEEQKRALKLSPNTSTISKNQLPAEKEFTLELNNKNSNLDDAFGRAFYNISVEQLYLEEVSGGGMMPSIEREIPIASDVEVEMEIRIPLYGTLTTTKMVSLFPVAPDAFPLQYNKYLDAGGDGAELDDVIVLHFGILNSLPLKGYAKIEFLDKENNVITGFDFKKPDSEVVDSEFPLFIPCGEVNEDGRVSKPEFLEHLHKMSKKSYETLGSKAKNMRMTYYFISPNADVHKRVRLTKHDILLLQIAGEVKGRIEPLEINNVANRINSTK